MRDDYKKFKTTDYTLFSLSPFNRDIRKTRRLRWSMERHQFRPEFPIVVVRDEDEDGHFIIKDGHHRFHVARELELPIWFIIAPDDEFPIQLAERTRNTWNLEDFFDGSIRENPTPDLLKVKRYREATGIPLSLCLSMLAGETAHASSKQSLALKDQTYRTTAEGEKHAELVALMLDHFVRAEVPFAKGSNFVKALSKIAMVPTFRPAQMVTKIKKAASLLKSSTTVDGYVLGLSRLYAWHTREGGRLAPMALAVAADVAARERSPIHRNEDFEDDEIE